MITKDRNIERLRREFRASSQKSLIERWDIHESTGERTSDKPGGPEGLPGAAPRVSFAVAGNVLCLCFINSENMKEKYCFQEISGKRFQEVFYTPLVT